MIVSLVSESVYRDCLPGGSWFSCPTDADKVVGWTNYTQCWSKATIKVMEGLNAQNCPSNATDDGRYVSKILYFSK